MDAAFATLCEIEADGALLVRSDQHVGWRVRSLPEDPASALTAALRQILWK